MLASGGFPKIKGDSCQLLPVDDAEEMLLALLDSPLGTLTLGSIRRLVLAVEQVVGGGRQGSSDTGNVVSQLEDGLIERLINHDGTHVEVVVGSSRAMNDDGASATGTILGQRVRVVPTCAVGAGMLLGCQR